MPNPPTGRLGFLILPPASEAIPHELAHRSALRGYQTGGDERKTPTIEFTFAAPVSSPSTIITYGLM